MRKKMIGIFVCILLVFTTLSNIAESKIEKKKPLTSSPLGLLYFEYSVSLDDDTAIVGAYRADVPTWAGSVYVFTNTDNIWRQQERIFAPYPADDYSFGWSVSVSGDTILIGAPMYSYENSPGYVYVFTRTGNTWMQQAKLNASDGAAWDVFGLSVSLDGDTALIGAPFDDDNGNWSGSAYVFTRTGTVWTQQAKLVPPDGAELDFFGASVSIDGDTALIGAPADGVTSSSSGCAYVFTRTGSTWTKQSKIIASDCTRKDQFGLSVSLEGDTALIGAQQHESNWGTGRAYVYTRTGNTWTQQARLLALDGAIGDSFGYSVAVSNDTALIGAYTDDYGGGSAYVFIRSGSTWTQQQKLQVSDKLGARFGTSVALEGDTALIASFFSGDVETFGSAYIFIRTGTIWTEEKQLLNFKIVDNKNNQVQREITVMLSINKQFYQFIERLFQRFPHAFPLLRYLMEY